jgi:aryl-alcohol dehydrogenase-like predicted oxidoreductase
MNEAPCLPQTTLGRTGLQVSKLAMAANPMTAAGEKGLKLKAEEVERAFHEYGVTTFLVGPFMKELTEGLRRLIAQGHRDKLVIASGSALPFGWNVGRSVRRTARTLGTDRIDIFLVGMVLSRRYLTGRTWPALQKLKEDGLTRAIGYSSHNRKLATSLAKEFNPDVMMIRYSAAHRGAEADIFEPLGDDRPAIISYTSTRWGLLLQPLPEKGFPKAMTAGECYRFVLGHPSVDIVLFAPRTATELKEDVTELLEGPLTPERMEEARRFGDAVHASASGKAKRAFQ